MIFFFERSSAVAAFSGYTITTTETDENGKSSELRTSKFIVIAAASYSESSQERNKHGVFTTALLAGLGCNNNGYYSIDKAVIQETSKIISNYIDYNTELGHNVMKIMRGEQPNTYFLTNLQQKVR